MRLVDADLIEQTHKGSNWDLHKVLNNATTVDAVPKSALEDIKAEINAIPIVTRHGLSGTVMTAQGMRKKLIEILDKNISGEVSHDK